MMKWLLLILIRGYWTVMPEGNRRRCLFRESCSRYVYRQAREKGLFGGLVALRHRWGNCRGGYHLFEHPVDGSKMMVLPGGRLIGQEEIAVRLLH
jgi:putative component of membrane protein insertase Oxa1/YidC/SpoIIIJ protein YidD